MDEEADPITQRAEDLRRSFDGSFANAHRGEADPHEDFVTIRVAANVYAIRLTEISGLFDGKTVTPVPGSVPGLLGVASFRGTIVPVFDLRALLGYPGSELPRWLALVPGASPVSLAFDQFEGYLRVSRSAAPIDYLPGPQREIVREVVSVAGTLRPVLHLPSILDEIGKRARRGLEKER